MANERLRNRRDLEIASKPVWPTTYLGAERRDGARRRRLIERVWGEYQEMPGMSLTAGQACRLFGLRQDVCDRLLRELVTCGVLRCTSDGQYVLARPAA